MDSNTDLSSKLTYYSTSSSVSKMPKHMVSSQAVNKEPPCSARKIRKESVTHRNKPCQTDSCRGKLVSTGVNYEQPNSSSASTPQSNQHNCPFSNSPPASCYPPPPSSCYPPPPPRPCFMPPSCYPPPPCPHSMPDSQHSQQSQNYTPYPQFYSPGPNRMGKPCWYRILPPPCPYPLYPQYDMGAQQHLSMNDQEQDGDQWEYPNQMKQYGLMPNDSHDAAYDDINEGFDMNDIRERDYNNQYQYNDDDNFDENVCSDCRLNDNDEEQLWQEQLSMQRPHCSPPPSFSCYPPPAPAPAMSQCFPKPKCCPAKKRHCKKMQGVTDMRNIECDHCKAKAPNMECNHCKNRAERLAERNVECDHCKAKPPNMECNHCKNKTQTQQNAKSAETEYQHQFNKKCHRRQ